jgi:hypothetical protein
MAAKEKYDMSSDQFIMQACSSFNWQVLRLRLNMSAGSVLGKLSSWLAPQSGKGQQQSSGKKLSAEEDPDCIHIFTVASGLMYERLQKIMILSVLRTTKCAPPPLCPLLISCFGDNPSGPPVFGPCHKRNQIKHVK